MWICLCNTPGLYNRFKKYSEDYDDIQNRIKEEGIKISDETARKLEELFDKTEKQFDENKHLERAYDKIEELKKEKDAEVDALKKKYDMKEKSKEPIMKPEIEYEKDCKHTLSNPNTRKVVKDLGEKLDADKIVVS